MAFLTTAVACIATFFLVPEPTFAALFGNITSILYVALGLGLVIFFHELGHFAVAKWCDVNVERFSIGFGPIIWSTKRGETEYAFSLVPFGGYVKMLGQDDMDASQMASEEIAEDPRSYSAKSVPQRMAIISAGVIMNIITGMMFFAIAFKSGVDVSPPVIGNSIPGLPAWEAGVGYGDRITQINDRKIESFMDIMRGVALTRDDLIIKGVRRDGTEFEFTITPDESGNKRLIGASQVRDSFFVIPKVEDFPTAWPGTPAAAADFEHGDEIRQATAGGESPKEFEHVWQLHEWLARPDVKRETVEFIVKRKGELSEPISVAPHHFRTLGVRMDIGAITAIEKGSPADVAGFQIGDKITHVDGQEIGKELDPLRLPDYLHSRRPKGEIESATLKNEQGEEIESKAVIVEVMRPQTGGPKQVELKVTPRDQAAWMLLDRRQNAPVTAPAIGIAYHVLRNVLVVEEDSPAAKAGVQEGERIEKMVLNKPADESIGTRIEDDTITIKFGEKDSDDKPINNWCFAFQTLQITPTRTVTLTLSKGSETRDVEITPEEAKDWYRPSFRGLVLEPLVEQREADTIVEAMGMGIDHTRNSAVDIYLTLRNLFGGQISAKELHGPVGIAKVAYNVAKSGIPPLLLFLGFLSVNLAVLNFLPIPVLDGGHMVFLIWEGVTGKKPGERVLLVAQLAGFAFIVGLMLFVLYLDIFVHKSAG